MLSRTQLFHLDKLVPASVAEMNLLLALLEYAVKHYAIKVGLTNLNDLKQIYCNRKDIYYQDQQISYSPHTSEAEAEFRYIHHALEELMETIVETYYIYSKTSRYTQLNIECCVLNRSNIAISFDFY